MEQAAAVCGSTWWKENKMVLIEIKLNEETLYIQLLLLSANSICQETAASHSPNILPL